MLLFEVKVGSRCLVLTVEDFQPSLEYGFVPFSPVNRMYANKASFYIDNN